MRNLKKVLSMALAIVMMLGMMTFASAAEEKKTEAPKKVTTAADLSDMDKVVNKEAVSLLVDLKVVEGTDKGTFDPTGDVTRAVMAKLIYVAKMGA
ncbi:MAG: S-layer homology domain-containing protein, partial [Pseudoflavonifractor sp.]